MKVAMVAPFPYTPEEEYGGGIIQVTLRLSEALGKIPGVELYVLSKSEHVKSIEHYSDRCYHRIYYPRTFPGFDWLMLKYGMTWNLGKIIKDIKPDIIHVQGAPDMILSAQRIKNIPIVVTIHGIYAHEMKVWKSKLSWRGRVESWFMKRTEIYNVKKIKHLICITKEIKEFVSALNKKITIFEINNPIDDNFYSLPNNEEGKTILFIAAIVRRKGLHVLLEAFQDIKTKIPDVKLKIGGMWDWDRPYVDGLMKAYSEDIQTGIIEFLGGMTQEEIYFQMSRASVFVLPSLAESAPLVISQAMAAGKAVVATNVGGIPQMITDGKDGLLVKKEDPQGLSNAIVTVLSDCSYRKKLGEEAKNTSLRLYHSTLIAQKTVAAYKAILGVSS
jgi:glycosyltransferase involved in cell wall biosynthesis